MRKPEPRTSPITVSYLTMRRVIGVAGVALPAVLLAGGLAAGFGLPASISAYYFTHMRDVFGGLLCAVSMFLMAYAGYNRADRIAGIVAGAAALGVIVFPTSVPEYFPPTIPPSYEMYAKMDKSTPVGIFLIPGDVSVVIHLACAAVFFLSLAVIMLVLFTRYGKKREITGRKRGRNAVYIVCGAVILASIAALGAGYVFFKSAIEETNFVFICETVGLLAFGTGWLVKGETFPFARDRKERRRPSPLPHRLRRRYLHSRRRFYPNLSGF